MADVLPDMLRPGLRLVFCGTAAGSASARARAYYAGPGNSFWPTLHEVGLTPEQLEPAEFERLPEFGIGLTDICKVRHGSDEEVGTVEFDIAGLEQRIAVAEPAHLAFNGKNAARGALERDVDYGLQSEHRRRGRLGPAFHLGSRTPILEHRALARAGAELEDVVVERIDEIPAGTVGWIAA
ncbi:MAG TPA: mismatch-specific DNA-glycosylase [Solirubrobacterales bacterium]